MDTITATIEGNWNGTVTPDPNAPYVFANWSQAALYGSLTIIIGILGIFGNLMVFIAVALSKSLQDTTHVFVVNLAISDFLTALTLPFQGVAVIYGTRWPFGEVTCSLVGVMLLLSVPTSIVTMAAIAVNRYIIIIKSMRLHQKMYTRRGVAMMVTLLWLVPFVVVVIPQLIPATGGIKYNALVKSCVWDLEHPLVLVFQSIVSLFFLSCTIIIIFCYVAIYIFVWRHVKATRDSLRVSIDNISSLPETPSGRLNKKQIDITKNLTIVVVAFFICVLPFSSNLYVQYYSLRLAYFALLVTVSCCLNPMIYAVKHPSFQTVFKCMFLCRFKDIPQPSEWLKTQLGSKSVTNVSSSRNISLS